MTNIIVIENWILIFITFFALLIALLTYLLMSKKYDAKIVQFEREIKPKEDCTIFETKGTGIFQKIEIVAIGYSDVIITIMVDSTMVKESIYDLQARSSTYVRTFLAPFSGSIGQYSIEMDLQKNFSKYMKLSIENKDKSQTLKARGTVHYTIHKSRFRLF